MFKGPYAITAEAATTLDRRPEIIPIRGLYLHARFREICCELFRSLDSALTIYLQIHCKN